MILLLALVGHLVKSQVCEVLYMNKQTNTTLGVNIYPTSGSPFQMPLAQYFQGTGLQYSVNAESIFTVTESTSTTTILSQQSTWGSIVFKQVILLTQSPIIILINPISYRDTMPFFKKVLKDTRSLSQEMELMTSCQFKYKVNQPVILGSSTCYNIAFLNQNLIVSCIQNDTLIFYIIDPESPTDYIPVPISTGQTISFFPYPVSTNLQIITETTQGTQQTFVVASYTEMFNFGYRSAIYKFAIEQGTSLDQPYTVTTAYSNILLNSCGIFANSDGTYFSLTTTSLSLYNGNNSVASISRAGATKFYNFGVYQSSTIGLSQDYIIAITTSNGVQNYFYNSTTLQFIAGSLIGYPIGFNPIISESNYVLVNPEYVIVSNGTSVYSNTSQIVVFPSFYNTNQYFIWASDSVQNFTLNLNTLQNIILVFYIGGYDEIQLSNPTLGLTADIVQNSGTVSVTATSYNGSQCIMEFNYTFLNPSSPAQVSVEQLTNSNVPSSKPTVQALSPFFYGNNLTYTVQTNPVISKTTIKQVEILALIQPQSTNVSFGQIFINPFSNNSYLEIQQILIGTSNQFYCVYGGENIDQLVAYKGVYSQGVIIAAAVGPSANGYINIALLNQDGNIYIYNCMWYTPIESFVQPSSTITLQPEFPPTMSFNQLMYLVDLLYIVTTNPQSVLIYSSLTNEFLYVFNTTGFIPTAIYSNYQSYGNTIFIDNQYELIIAQCVTSGCVILQNIQYQSSSTQQSVGIGLLQNGIYIALSDGTTQSIQFYPREQIYTKQPLSVIVTIPTNFQLQYPIASSYTNTKFYISWINNQPKNKNYLELAIFQYSYGINNVLYHSQYIQQSNSINYLTAVSIDSNYPYDLVMINGYTTNQNNLIEFQVWNQTFVEFVPEQITNATQTFQVTYSAVSSSSQTAAQISQQILVLDPQVAVITVTAPQNYFNQFFYDYGLISIQPELYFDGIIQNYTASYFNYPNTSQKSDVTKIINPITSSPNQWNYGYQVVSAVTGRLNNNTTPMYLFYLTSYQFYYINPLYPLDNQGFFITAPLTGVVMFNTQYFLVIVGYNYTSDYDDAAQAYITNLTDNKFNFTPIPNLILSYNPGFAEYVEIQDQNIGLLTIQSIYARYNQMSISIYEVSSTPQTVNFRLIGQSEDLQYQPDIAITVLTNLYNTQRSANFYGILFASPQSIQILYYYGPIQDNITFVQANINIKEGFPEYDQIWIKQYTGLSYPDQITLAIQTPTWGGIFNMNLAYLDGSKTIYLKQIYSLQRFQNYLATGIQVQSNLLVSEFQTTENQSTTYVVGLYQDPSYYPVNTALNFKSFTLQNTYYNNFSINSILTTNGTLVLGAAGNTSVYYITSQLYLGLNLTEEYAVYSIGSSYVNLLVNAQNNYSSATQELYLQIQVLTGQVPQMSQEWYFVGFGVAFAVVIIGVLGFLFYKSSAKPHEYSEI